MHPSSSVFPFLFFLSFLLHFSFFHSCFAWTCETSCGSIPLQYPFGSGWNCGSSSIQPYVNCSSGNLLFYTPSGTYPVQSIDYTNKIIIVQDPRMSTCSYMQNSGAFGLPVSSPFSFATYDTVALIGCSSTSSLYSSNSCSSSSSEVCQSLYSCPGIAHLGISVNSPSSSCCVYSNSLLATAPYQIDLPLLQCSTYASIYQMGNVQDPQSTWLYGIALSFNAGSQSQPSSNVPYNSCYVCQQAEESGGAFGAMRVQAFWTGGLLLATLVLM